MGNSVFGTNHEHVSRMFLFCILSTFHASIILIFYQTIIKYLGTGIKLNSYLTSFSWKLYGIFSFCKTPLQYKNLPSEKLIFKFYVLFSSVVDPDQHGSGTFAWIRIQNYSAGSSFLSLFAGSWSGINHSGSTKLLISYLF